MITKEEVLESQKAWSSGIVKIGRAKEEKIKYESLSMDFLYSLYDFKKGNVQFKPTKASVNQFRNDIDSALSYFIGNNSDFSEDSGFALTPWIDVIFENISINCYGDIALAMGNYFFTDISGSKVKVEYTFAYIKRDEKLKIVLHHSSLPFSSN